MKTIVVGVDGSEGSERALRFAFEEARLRGAAIRAVAVWHIPAAAYSGGFAPVIPDVSTFEQAARERLDASVARMQEEAAGLEIELVVAEGQPAEILVEQSAGAELLVVGSRGLGGFRELLLGSVGHQCAHHATCPLVIVPRPTEGK